MVDHSLLNAGTKLRHRSPLLLLSFRSLPAGGLLERAEEKGLSDRYSWDDWRGMLRAVPERF